MFIGSYFFGVIGAAFRWAMQLIFNMNKPKKSFREIWGGSEDGEPSSEAFNEVLNNIIGVVLVVLIGILLMEVRI